jgi:hypothetical protein
MLHRTFIQCTTNPVLWLLQRMKVDCVADALEKNATSIFRSEVVGREYGVSHSSVWFSLTREGGKWKWLIRVNGTVHGVCIKHGNCQGPSLKLSRWKQHVPMKRCQNCTLPHGVIKPTTYQHYQCVAMKTLNWKTNWEYPDLPKATTQNTLERSSINASSNCR